MLEESVPEDRLNSLLKKYVNSEGKVDYSSLEEEAETVENYVRWLGSFDPENLKTRNEKLAFWINAYNMLTIYGVLTQLRKKPDFAKKGHKNFFQRFRFFWWTKYRIGGRKYSLYQIENKILREKFSEPRIHFALNCASQSCPLLKDGLYSAENLDQELDMAATLFIRSPKGARLDRKNRVLYLSSIFKWYRNDFEKSCRSIVEFVKKYLEEEDRKFIEDNLSEMKIGYQEYDWGLNVRN
ncbi:DUF547 domain-containing protein [Candidatus Bathyarchaeota archaeon]|nr:DUF547 domain-containing protein [Candidatus Bathyarchaeota archaeon]